MIIFLIMHLWGIYNCLSKQSTYSIAKVVLLCRDSSTSNGLTAEHDYNDPDNSIVVSLISFHIS